MFKAPKTAMPAPPPTTPKNASYASAGAVPSMQALYKPTALTGVAYNPLTGASTVRSGRPSLLGGM